MAQVRIEYALAGGERGALGGQVDTEPAEPLGAVTLTVTGTATVAGAQPIVPPGAGDATVATATALDAPVYLDVGPTPDPTVEPRRLVVPGRPLRLQVAVGDRFSAILASDVPTTAGGLAKTLRVVTLPAYAAGGAVTTVAPDGSSGTATVAANQAVQLLPANPSRRSLRIMNADANRATYGFAAWTAPGKGWPLAPASSPGDQGGGDDDGVPHTGAIYAASAAGTTLVVMEG